MRARTVVAPRSVAFVLHTRMFAQRVVDRAARRGLEDALAIAREEHAPLTTDLPARYLERLVARSLGRPLSRTGSRCGSRPGAPSAQSRG